MKSPVFFRGVLAAALISIVCANADAGTEDAEKRPLTLADRENFQFLENAKISADGEQISYTLDGQVFVWSASSDASRPVTSSSASAWAPRWSADGEYLYFVSDRGETNQIWKLPLSKFGEAEQLTHLQHGVDSIALSPDETRVLLSFSDNDLQEEFDDEEPKPFVVTRRQFKRDSGDGYITEGDDPHLYLYNLTSGGLSQLTSGVFSERGASWSADGRAVVFVSNREKDPDADYRSDLWIVSSDGSDADGTLTRLTNNTATKQSPAWSPDGELVAYITAEDGVYGVQHIAVVPATGGTPRILTKSLDRWIHTYRFSSDGKWIYFNFDDAGATHLAKVNVNSEEIELLIAGDAVVGSFDVSSAGAFSVSLNHQYDRANLYRYKNGTPQRVTDLNRELVDRLLISEKSKVSFDSKDGTVIEAFVTTPPDFRSGKSYPTILNLHGGPVGQTSWGYDFTAQFFSAHGYVVVEPNPRGSTGQGQDFIRAIYRTWGITDYDDVIASVDYLVAQGVADPNRLVVTGYSYGGYLTNVAITQTKRFMAAATGAGHSLLAANVGHDIYQQWYSWELGVPWENREKYDRLSPLLRAGLVETPTLFLGGRDDWNVPILNAELFYQALKMKGVDTQLVVYPDSHHGGWSAEFENDYLRRLVNWFDLYTGAE